MKRHTRTKADEWLELLTVVGQVIVLSFGFALVFSWEADIQPRALAMIVLVLLVLIYPMGDRLKNILQQEIKELHKAHGFTQTIIVFRNLMEGKSEYEQMSTDEKLRKAQEIVKQLENVQKSQIKFSEGFDKGFEDERKESGSDRIEFIANAFGIVVYLFILIGISVFIGWLISLAF